jgi:hypothetical protein
VNTVNTATGQILNWDGITVGGSGVTFASLTATGVVAGGDGILLNNVDGGTLNGGNVTIASTTGAGNHGVEIAGGSAATMQFGTVRVDGSVNGNGIFVTGGGNGDITIGSVDIDGAGASGIFLNGHTGTFTVNGGTIGATTTNGTGVAISSGDNTVAIAADITSSAGAVFQGASVQNRTGGTVTFSGAINDTVEGIGVQNNTSGTVTFSGPVTLNTGSNAAVSLTSNTGATVNFTGGLDIDTTSGTGFTATGGGTVTVQGTGNSVTTTTGRAVNIANTTIGAAGVTFRSVSSNGATNGIVLNTTGTSGGFTVTGDGTTPVGRGGNNSGGQILNSTGSGILLTDTRNVSLAHMNITDAADHGIDALRVNGFSGAYLTLNSNGNANEEHGIRIRDAAGVYDFTKLSAEGNFDAHIRVLQQSGANSLTSFTVNDSLFQNVTTGTFEDGILFEMQTNTFAGSLTIQNSNFNNHDGDHVQVALNGTASITTTTINNNATTATGANLGGGLTVNHAGTYAGSHTVNITDNNIQGANVQSINVNLGGHQAAATVNTTITGNIIGTAGVAGSGGFTGIEVEANGLVGSPGGTMTALIDNNVIREYTDIGISIAAVDGAGTTATLNATITNNTVTEALGAGAGFAAIFVDAQNNNTVCVDIGGAGVGNTLSGTGFATDVSIRTNTGATVNLEGYGGAGNDSAAINAYLTGRNAMSAGIHQFNAGSTAQGGGACPVP